MELTVNKSEFKKALEVTQRALPKVIIQEERGHILLRVRGDRLLLSGTNNDFKALYKITLKETPAHDFEFTVEPKTVLKLITKVKMDELKITLNLEDNKAKYYTNEGGKSFAEAQSFTGDVMLSFEDTVDKCTTEVVINREAMIQGLNYAKEYLEAINVEKARYDFIIINNGLIYAANGSNRMGFLVNKEFKNFNNYKIRKIYVPLLLRTLESTGDEDIVMYETGKDTGVKTTDGAISFTCAKSDISVPDIKREDANTNGPYCLVDRKSFLESLDRLGAMEPTGKSYGVQLVLKGSGDDASIELASVTTLKSKEVMPCKRIDEGTEDIDHVADSKVLKSIVSSFKNPEIRMFINTPDKKFKVYEKGDLRGAEYHAFAIGAYSKVLRNN